MKELNDFKPVGAQIAVLKLIEHVDKICMYGAAGSGRTELLVRLAAQGGVSAFAANYNKHYTIKRLLDFPGAVHNLSQQYVDIPGINRVWLLDEKYHDPMRLRGFRFNFIAVDMIADISDEWLDQLFDRLDPEYGKIVVAGYIEDKLKFLARNRFSFVSHSANPNLR